MMVKYATKEEYASHIMKDMKELHSSVFTNATSYANTIILAGYAGAFAIWGLTKDKLDSFWTGIVAILLMISISVFVLFEIYKMVKAVGVQVAFIKNIRNQTTPDSIISAFEQLKERETSGHQDMMVIWYASFSISVLTGFFAALILLCCLVEMTVSNV